MNARRCPGLIALLGVGTTTVLQAAGLGTNNLNLRTEPNSGSFLEMLLRMLGALLFVVSVFVLGAWLFKRSRLFALKGGPAQLRILEAKSLGYRNSLLVVAYDQHRFLLATSATGVSLLSPLPDASTTVGTVAGHASFPEQQSAVQGRKT